MSRAFPLVLGRPNVKRRPRRGLRFGSSSLCPGEERADNGPYPDFHVDSLPVPENTPWAMPPERRVRKRRRAFDPGAALAARARPEGDRSSMP